ncbi:MAG: hypothetical protein HY069_03750 [Chlamydiia bacterium]|nr:hypothetical protein [Chlamydiia bacterium]
MAVSILQTHADIAPYYTGLAHRLLDRPVENLIRANVKLPETRSMECLKQDAEMLYQLARYSAYGSNAQKRTTYLAIQDANAPDKLGELKHTVRLFISDYYPLASKDQIQPGFQGVVNTIQTQWAKVDPSTLKGGNFDQILIFHHQQFRESGQKLLDCFLRCLNISPIDATTYCPDANALRLVVKASALDTFCATTGFQLLMKA